MKILFSLSCSQYFQLRAVLDKRMRILNCWTSSIQIQTVLCAQQKLLAPTMKTNFITLLNFSFDQYMHGQHPVVRSRSFHSNQHLPPHMSRMTCSRSASFSGIQSSHLDAGVGAMSSVDGVQSVVYSSEHAVSSRSHWWELVVMRKIGTIVGTFPKKSLDVIWAFKKCLVDGWIEWTCFWFLSIQHFDL